MSQRWREYLTGGKRLNVIKRCLLFVVVAVVTDRFVDAIEQGLFDHVRLWNTAQEKFILIGEGERKNFNVVNRKLWQEFLAKGSKRAK